MHLLPILVLAKQTTCHEGIDTCIADVSDVYYVARDCVADCYEGIEQCICYWSDKRSDKDRKDQDPKSEVLLTAPKSQGMCNKHES